MNFVWWIQSNLANTFSLMESNGFGRQFWVMISSGLCWQMWHNEVRGIASRWIWPNNLIRIWLTDGCGLRLISGDFSIKIWPNKYRRSRPNSPSQIDRMTDPVDPDGFGWRLYPNDYNRTRPTDFALFIVALPYKCPKARLKNTNKC